MGRKPMLGATVAAMLALAPATAGAELPNPELRLAPESQSGFVNYFTRDATPTVEGDGLPGAVVELYRRPPRQGSDGDKLLGTTTVGKNGLFRFTIENLKAQKNYILAKVSFGGEEVWSDVDVFIDTDAPRKTPEFALGKNRDEPAPISLRTDALIAVVGGRSPDQGGRTWIALYRDGKLLSYNQELSNPSHDDWDDWYIEIPLPENEKHSYQVAYLDYAGNRGPLSKPITIDQRIDRTAIDTIDLSNLSKRDGVTIVNSSSKDEAAWIGTAASRAGDVNGDGFDDVLIATGMRGYRRTGTTYVVLGKARGSLPKVIDAYGIDPADGFRISTVGDGRTYGAEVAGGGDVDCDGLDDVVIGAPEAQTAFVVFGSRKAARDVELSSDLPPSIGARITKSAKTPRVAGFAASVAVLGDVDGNGCDDLAVGASPWVPDDFPAGVRYPGHAYVVFGRKNLGRDGPIVVESLKPEEGFRIDGELPRDLAGALVARAGDVNGDGLADVLVGAPGRLLGKEKNVGALYVVFGRRSRFPMALALADLDGHDGFVIPGVLANDRIGLGPRAVNLESEVFSHADNGATAGSAGDVNGDGADDLVFTAYGGEVSSVDPAPRNARIAFVVFGKRDGGFPPRIDITKLGGTDGFRARISAIQVGGVGDVDGDGIDDVLFGGRPEPSSGYLLLGQRKAFPKLVEFDITRGVRTVRIANYARQGPAGGAGDFDGDGLDDVLIGDWGYGDNGDFDESPTSRGGGYVLFGRKWK